MNNMTYRTELQAQYAEHHLLRNGYHVFRAQRTIHTDARMQILENLRTMAEKRIR